MTAQDVIKALNLAPLPEEGGYYRQTFKDEFNRPNSQGEKRAASTCIYYLITKNHFRF